VSKNNREGLVILLRGVALAILFSGTFGYALVFSNLLIGGCFLILAIAVNYLASELDKHFDTDYPNKVKGQK
jgi:hypothetical protein